MDQFIQLLGAAVAALGGLKGIEYVRYRVNHRKYNGENDRRRNNSLSTADKEYLRLISADMCREMGNVVRDEGNKTRSALHAMERAIMAEMRRGA